MVRGQEVQTMLFLHHAKDFCFSLCFRSTLGMFSDLQLRKDLQLRRDWMFVLVIFMFILASPIETFSLFVAVSKPSKSSFESNSQKIASITSSVLAMTINNWLVTMRKFNLLSAIVAIPTTIQHV